MFYFGEYAEQSKVYDVIDKKVINKMKDGTKDIPIIKFLRLKAKMYSFTKKDDKGDKKAKGINKTLSNK